MKQRNRIKKIQRKYYPIHVFFRKCEDEICKKIIIHLENKLLAAFGINNVDHRNFVKSKEVTNAEAR
jgi:hypothetical protein